MTKKEILQAAEENSMNYCMQRGMAKQTAEAFMVRYGP